jgi:putative ATPase
VSDLFSEAAGRRLGEVAPLAQRLRPQTLDEFVGQEHIVGPGRALRLAIEQDRVPSMILYGPPGSGKTTLARIVAQTTGAEFEELSAVSATVSQVREVLGRARERLGAQGRRTILFLDEIHRFNKAQQDALLPGVEDGLVTLIGATTENPYFEVNSALLSRAQVYELVPLSEEMLATVARRGAETLDVELPDAVLALMARRAGGDARNALNILELAVETARAEEVELDERHVEDAATKRPLVYDKGGDAHYDFISAWIKSTRAGDVQASVYYLAAMLEGGEDARFIARRMIVLASEDVGNADPQALLIAVAAAHAVEHVGLPEARLNLAQAAVYLARAPKSNASYVALARATEDVREHGHLRPPAALRSAGYVGARKLGRGRGYVYPHDDPEGFEVDCLPEELVGRVYFEPSGMGQEVELPRNPRDVPAPAEARDRAGGADPSLTPTRPGDESEGSGREHTAS